MLRTVAESWRRALGAGLSARVRGVVLMVMGSGRSTRRSPVRAAAFALSGMLATLAVALSTSGAPGSTLATDPDRIGDLTGPLAAAPANSVANPGTTTAR